MSDDGVTRYRLIVRDPMTGESREIELESVSEYEANATWYRERGWVVESGGAG